MHRSRKIAAEVFQSALLFTDADDGENVSPPVPGVLLPGFRAIGFRVLQAVPDGSAYILGEVGAGGLTQQVGDRQTVGDGYRVTFILS